MEETNFILSQQVWICLLFLLAFLIFHYFDFVKRTTIKFFGFISGNIDTEKKHTCNCISNAAIAIFSIISTLLFGAGLKYLHIYFDLHRIPFNNIDMPIYEIIYKPSVIFYHEFKIGILFLFLCILFTVFASVYILGGRRASILIASLVPIGWLFFGGHFLDEYQRLAQERFVKDVINRDNHYPRIVGVFREKGKDQETETEQHLNHGCFYLILQDKKSLYVMLDPTIEEWNFDIKIKKEVSEEIRSSCEKEDQNIKQCIKEKEDKEIQKISDERFGTPDDLYLYIRRMRKLIKTAQIPTDLLGTLYTLPLGTPLDPACKVAPKPKQVRAPAKKPPVEPCPPCPDTASPPCTCSQ